MSKESISFTAAQENIRHQNMELLHIMRNHLEWLTQARKKDAKNTTPAILQLLDNQIKTTIIACARIMDKIEHPANITNKQ